MVTTGRTRNSNGSDNITSNGKSKNRPNGPVAHLVIETGNKSRGKGRQKSGRNPQLNP